MTSVQDVLNQTNSITRQIEQQLPLWNAIAWIAIVVLIILGIYLLFLVFNLIMKWVREAEARHRMQKMQQVRQQVLLDRQRRFALNSM